MSEISEAHARIKARSKRSAPKLLMRHADLATRAAATDDVIDNDELYFVKEKPQSMPQAVLMSIAQWMDLQRVANRTEGAPEVYLEDRVHALEEAVEVLKTHTHGVWISDDVEETSEPRETF